MLRPLTASWAIVLSILVTASCATAPPPGPVPPEPEKVGQTAPDLVVRRMDGQEMRLSSHKGKVVLLDIWASWCAPCKEEMPVLDELAQKLKARGVEVIAVSVDEDREAAEHFLRTRPSWALTIAHDPDGRVPSQLQPEKMPTSYVIDRQGVIRHVNSGFRREDARVLERQLLSLTAE